MAMVENSIVLTSLSDKILKALHMAIAVNYQCVGKRTFATPKPNPYPTKPSFFQKPSFKSPKNSKNTGVYSEHNT